MVKGDAVTYRLTVHNHGPDSAAHVVLADQPRGDAKIISVDPSTGQCTIGKLVICRLGNMKSGATVSIMVRLIPDTTKKAFVNRVAVGSATADPKPTNNISQATIKVLVPPSPPVACGSRLILLLVRPADHKPPATLAMGAAVDADSCRLDHVGSDDLGVWSPEG